MSSPTPETPPTSAHDVWYLAWRDTYGRDIPKTARNLNISESQMYRVADAERWRERARADDRSYREDATTAAVARLAHILPHAVTTLEAAVRVRLTHDRKLPPDAPSSGAVKAALASLAMFGIAPVRVSTLNLNMDATPHRIPAAELDALIAAGMDGSDDAMSALLALAAGAPSPHFTSTQPGGRVVPSPPSPVGSDAESEADDRGSAVFDALFAEAVAVEDEE